jgi:acyl-homoserine-lactone acylase
MGAGAGPAGRPRARDRHGGRWSSAGSSQQQQLRVRVWLVAFAMERLQVLGRHVLPATGLASDVAAGGSGEETEILWDTFGVPHIIAPTHPALFHAYGWAQMEAHSELLLSLYAQAQGRGAEFYGADSTVSGLTGASPLLDADRWVRTNDIPATARRWADTQRCAPGMYPVPRLHHLMRQVHGGGLLCSPEFGPLIESFAAGVSAWAAEHTDQLSPAAAAVLAGLGGAITAPHVYAHCLRVIHYDWIVSPTRLAARLRPAKVDVHGSNEWAIGE